MYNNDGIFKGTLIGSYNESTMTTEIISGEIFLSCALCLNEFAFVYGAFGTFRCMVHVSVQGLVHDARIGDR